MQAIAGVPLLCEACSDDLERNAFSTPGKKVPGHTPLSLSTQVQVEKTLANQSFKHDSRACSVPTSLLPVALGDQVRIIRNIHEYALYTVFSRRVADNPSTVRMGDTARLRLGTTNTFNATIVKPVVAVGLSDAQAEAASEFVERLVDDGQNSELVVIAPHGGIIETNTDRQAEAVTDALECSSWVCKGWKAGGGGYERWHITSTQLSPRSFPGLGLIANRGFTYAVAFHGMSASGILVGGAAPLALKILVRNAILDELSDPDIDVDIAEFGDANSGTSPKNVVNWLTSNGMGGIQLEQSMKVRVDHWHEVANAVINLYSELA